MNKFGMVVGLAAVATLAGCKDPDFKRAGGNAAQNVAKNVETTPVTVHEIEPAVKRCTCAPGTKHETPCACGASDCRCVVAAKPVIVADLSAEPVAPAPAASSVAPSVAAPSSAAASAAVTKPAEPEYTIYIVQSGDYLAKISKRYNVTIAAILKLNPSIKNNLIRVGQKLKLPGKIDVGEQKAPEPKPAAAKPELTAYTGPTREYVVRSGDTLGAIAYGNGINIRQLKLLNGLKSDTVKVGQKLKIPAEKVVASAKPVSVKPAVEKPAPAVAKVAAPVEKASVAEEQPAAPVAAAAPAAEAAVKPEEPKAADAAQSTTTYIVQEGDDMIGVAIRWGVTAADIRELNNMSDGDKLVPGQVIKLPADAQQ